MVNYVFDPEKSILCCRWPAAGKCSIVQGLVGFWQFAVFRMNEIKRKKKVHYYFLIQIQSESPQFKSTSVFQILGPFLVVVLDDSSIAKSIT